MDRIVRFRRIYATVRHSIWRGRWWLVSIAITGALFVAAIPVYALWTSRGNIFNVSSVPKHSVAIVFGAGVYPDGTPTPYLESRLIVAIQLYRAGKTNVLIMSGDNSTMHYNEPAAMKRYAIRHGVPAAKIVLDYAGYDTYDTCYRAHAIFGVSSAILVSHGYHLPRALMTCRGIGVQSVGVRADRAGTSYSKNYLLREVLSLNKAGVQLLFKVTPGVLGPEDHSVTDALKL